MNEIRVHHYLFLPLFEVLFSSNLKADLSFLKQELLLPYLFNTLKKSYKVNSKQTPFVLRYGDIKIRRSRDTEIYYKYLLPQAYNGEPLRPLIALSTKRVKWNALKGYSNQYGIRNAIAAINLNLNLIAEIYRSYSVLTNAPIMFDELLKKSEHILRKEAIIDKKALLKALFDDTRDIYVTYSECLTIIECPIENLDFIGLKKETLIANGERIIGGWLYELAKNRWIIAYSTNKMKPTLHTKKKKKKIPHKRLRERLIMAIKCAIMLKHALYRLSDILKSDNICKIIISELPVKEKIRFIEYIVGSFNPEFYSTLKKERAYYLPQSYQRITFNYVQEKFDARGIYKHVYNQIVSWIEAWDPYDQMFLLSKANLVITPLKKVIKISKEPSSKPICLIKNEKMDVIIKVMLNYYKNLINRDGSFGERMIKRDDTFASMTLNKLKEEYSKYIKAHYTSQSRKVRSHSNIEKPISYTFFRQKDIPPELTDLEAEGLINIIPMEQGKEKYRYALNIKHEYIRSMLFHG